MQPTTTQKLYVTRNGDGSVRLHAPRRTAEVFCPRHSFVDTHLIARVGAENLHNALENSGREGNWAHILNQLLDKTNARLDETDEHASLTYLGVSTGGIPMRPGWEEEVMRAWAIVAEEYADEVEDAPRDCIGTVNIEVPECS